MNGTWTKLNVSISSPTTENSSIRLNSHQIWICIPMDLTGHIPQNFPFLNQFLNTKTTELPWLNAFIWNKSDMQNCYHKGIKLLVQVENIELPNMALSALNSIVSWTKIETQCWIVRSYEQQSKYSSELHSILHLLAFNASPTAAPFCTEATSNTSPVCLYELFLN